MVHPVSPGVWMVTQAHKKREKKQPDIEFAAKKGHLKQTKKEVENRCRRDFAEIHLSNYEFKHICYWLLFFNYCVNQKKIK